MTLAKVLIQIIENTVTTIEEYIGDIPNQHLKDVQAKLVYDAEDECYFWQNFEVLSDKQTKNLINQIALFFSVQPPNINFNGHIYGIAYATSDLIVLPFPYSKSVPYICHEMAHVINYQDETMADHHGINFSGIYLNIVKEFIGLDAYKELKNSFDTLGVRYNLN